MNELGHTADEVKSIQCAGLGLLTPTPPTSPEHLTLPWCAWLLNSDKGTGFMLVPLPGCPLKRTLGPSKFVCGCAAAFLFLLKKFLRTDFGVD